MPDLGTAKRYVVPVWEDHQWFPLLLIAYQKDNKQLPKIKRNLSLFSSLVNSMEKVHTIETGIQGWLNLEAHLHFHSDGNSFIHLAPVKIDDADFFTNIVMVDAVKRHSWPVTRHPFEIFEILAWDVKRSVV
jgi:hypothetical protein